MQMKKFPLNLGQGVSVGDLLVLVRQTAEF